MRLRGRLFTLLVAALVAAPAMAYTIYLKDGSRLLAKKKYEVKGTQAIITLPSGQETAIRFSEIDVPRTDKANEQDLGTAILIEGGEAKDLADGQAPEPPRPQLGDLIRSGEARVQSPADSTDEANDAAAAKPVQRPKGFGAESVPGANGFTRLRDTNLAGSLKSFVAGRGLGVEVFQGSSPRRPLLFYETESEANVFRSLLATAAALIEVRNSSPGAVEGLEMVCQTSEGSPAGRFTLTPAQAADLLSGKVEITRFFVDNVEF